jgi:hypothetical protein
VIREAGGEIGWHVAAHRSTATYGVAAGPGRCVQAASGVARQPGTRCAHSALAARLAAEPTRRAGAGDTAARIFVSDRGGDAEARVDRNRIVDMAAAEASVPID